MSGSASITALMSAAMRSRSSFGMLGGPNSPTSPSIVSAGYPASATVGTSGIAEARAVLESVAQKFNHHFEFSTHLMGCCAIDAHGTALPDETLAACRASDAVYRVALPG